MHKNSLSVYKEDEADLAGLQMSDMTHEAVVWSAFCGCRQHRVTVEIITDSN